MRLLTTSSDNTLLQLSDPDGETGNDLLRKLDPIGLGSRRITDDCGDRNAESDSPAVRSRAILSRIQFELPGRREMQFFEDLQTERQTLKRVTNGLQFALVYDFPSSIEELRSLFLP